MSSKCFFSFTREHLVVQYLADAFETSKLNTYYNRVNLSSTSCFFLDSDNKLRQVLLRTMYSFWFRCAVMTLIMINTLVLILRDPYFDRFSGLQTFLDWVDVMVAILFTVEAFVKIVALGFVLHPHSYLRDVWNIVDLVVVIAGLEDLVSLAIHGGSIEGGGDAFTSLRVIRVFRPLRSLAQAQGLRDVMTKLGCCLPSILPVFGLLALLVWFTAAVGVQLWRQELDGRCFANVTELFLQNATSSITSPLRLIGTDTYALVQSDHLTCGLPDSLGGRSCGPRFEWENITVSQTCIGQSIHYSEYTSVLNYDNIFHGILLTFKLVCKDNWPEDYVNLAAAVGMLPAFFFTLCVTLVVGYLCVSFFTAVFEDTFAAMRGTQSLQGILVAEEEGERVADDVRFSTIIGARIVAPAAVFSSYFRPDVMNVDEESDHSSWMLHHLTSQPQTETLTHIYKRQYHVKEYVESEARPIGTLNGLWKRTIRPWLRRGGVPRVQRIVQSAQYNLIVVLLAISNAALLAAIRYPSSAEATHRIELGSFVIGILFGVEAVFKIIGLGPSYFLSNWNLLDFTLCLVSIPELATDRTSFFSPLRALRVVRLLRLGHRWTSLRRLMKLLGSSFSEVSSVAFVGIVVMLSYALFGFQLFNCQVPGHRFSFETVFESFLTVFTCVTGEDQNNIAAALVPEFGYWVQLYFISLTIFGNFVWTNLFIAVILENFSMTEVEEIGLDIDEEEALRLKRYDGDEELLQFADFFANVGRRWFPDTKRAQSVAPAGRVSRSSSSIRPQNPHINGGGDEEMHTALLLQHREDELHSSPIVQDYSPREDSEERGRQSSYRSPSPHAREADDASAEEVYSFQHPPHAGRVVPMAAASTFFREDLTDDPDGEGGDGELYASSNDITSTELSVVLKDWGGVRHPSLWGLQREHPLRRLAISILRHPAYDVLSLILTLSSSIMLALDEPGRSSDSNWETALLVTDCFFCVVFWLEVAVKVVALGLLRHRGAYLRSPWNITDILVATFSFLALFVPEVKPLRSLRILRLLNVSFSLRVLVKALVSAIPQVGSVLVFVSLLFLIFAVIGGELFRGHLYFCTDPSIAAQEDCVGLFNRTNQEQLGSVVTVATREWLHAQPISSSFDTFEQSLYTIYKLANQDAWFEPMYSAVDSPTVSSPLAGFFFVSFMIIGQFFSVNLVIGVLVDRFVLQRQKGEGYGLLTEAQSQWVLVQKAMLRLTLVNRPPRPRSMVRGMCYDVISHPWVEHAFTACIVVNAIVVSAIGLSEDEDVNHALDMSGIVLLGVFFLEILLKLIAFGPRRFFKRKSLCFDCLIVVGSVVALSLGVTGSSAVAVFRAARLLLLFKRVRTLQTILHTWFHALPEFANVAVILFSVFFIFAVIGVRLFHDTPFHPEEDSFNEYVNFQSVPRALITLYIMMTEETWSEICDALAHHSWAARPYCIIFMVSCAWIGSHLLVTVVIDVFGETEETKGMDSSLRVIESFRQHWKSFDPKGKRVLQTTTVIEHILPHLPSRVWDRVTAMALLLQSRRKQPNGRGGPAATPFLATLKQLSNMHIPVDYQKNVRFEDCLASVALRLFSIPVAEAITISQRAVYGVTWSESEYCLHHEYAALKLTRWVRSVQQKRRAARAA